MNNSFESLLTTINLSTFSSVISESTVEVNLNFSSFTGNITNSTVCEPKYIDFRNNSRFWIQRVLVPIIMIIGVIGNSITIVIMTRRKMRSSTNSYLAALATFDMLYLIFIFLLSLSAYPNIKDIQYYYYWYLWPFAIMIVDASSNTSIWLTVTFTIERYIAVCHPIKGKVFCTESRAKRVILCVFLICFAFTTPTPFEWVVLEKNDTETNKPYMVVTFSELGQNDLYKTVYYYLNVILFALIPFLLLAIFNAFLIRSVHISRKQRNTMIQGEATKIDPTSKQEARITIMLISVVILFFLCQLPTASVLIYTVFYTVRDDTNIGCLIRGLGNIFNFLLAINATGNCVLYCLLSQKYRRTFLAIFCPCLKDKFLTHQSAYQRTFYTQVGNNNINKSSENELSIRFKFNQNSRRLSSPRQRIFHSNQQLTTGRLSTGSLTPYISENTRPIKCSRSANYLQVPTGSTSKLMYDNSVSSSCDEEDNSSDIDDRTHNSIESTHQKSVNILNSDIDSKSQTFDNSVENSLTINEELIDTNLKNNLNINSFAANTGNKCDAGKNKISLNSNGSTVLLDDNTVIGDNGQKELRSECNDSNANVGKVLDNNNKLNTNKIDSAFDKSENKFLTTAVVNNTTQL